jgi:hypothetical protein
MNDTEVLDEVRGLVAGLHMRTPAETILARGRSRRRRRSARMVAGGATVLAVAGLGLAFITGSSADRPTQDGHPVELASFSVVSDPDGTTTLTLTKGEAVDTDALRTKLAQAGVPAEITIDRFCHNTNGDRATFDRVVSVRPQDDGTEVLVITPAAMPAGTKLSIGVFPNRRAWNLITDGAPLTCSREPT